MSKIGINLNTEKLYQELIQIISQSGLPPANIIFVLRTVSSEIDILYQNQLAKEKQEYLDAATAQEENKENK